MVLHTSSLNSLAEALSFPLLCREGVSEVESEMKGKVEFKSKVCVIGNWISKLS